MSGATGYIGVHLVKALIDQGMRSKAIVRSESNPKDIQLLESLGAEVICLNALHNGTLLSNAMQGSEVLVHLIGSIAPKRGVQLKELQTEIAETFFRSAQDAGIKKVILLTALGCGPGSKSEYHRTKWLAEEALKKSGLKYVIFRPSLVVGRTVGHRDSKIVRRYLDLIRNKKAVPLVGGGRNRIQPIFVGDLVQAISKTVLQGNWDNSILELGGGEVLTTRQFVEKLMKAVNRKRNLKSIPAPLAWIAAGCCELFQEVPLLSRDQLKIAKMDSVPTRNALTEDFKIKPVELEQVLSTHPSFFEDP